MIYTELTKKAMKICFEAHKDQVDKSEMPYVFHPFHLAEQMQDEYTTIRVEMVNSKRLHKALGKTFIPTPKSDGRILGVAISDKSGYTLMVENGSPRMASMLTMAHELTHIWQYLNWNDKNIVKKYGKNLRLEIYEGMAKWVEIQYAYLINEPSVAKREELITALRQDEYGRGFLRYLANYPFSLGTVSQ